MRVTGVAHVSVNTHGTDLEQVTRFYRALFDLPDRPRPPIPGVGGHWFGVGDAELHLVDAPRLGTPIDPVGPHFCVFVDDLDAAIAELDDNGIQYLRAAQGSVEQVWVADPAGNTVELQQDPATEPGSRATA